MCTMSLVLCVGTHKTKKSFILLGLADVRLNGCNYNSDFLHWAENSWLAATTSSSLSESYLLHSSEINFRDIQKKVIISGQRKAAEQKSDCWCTVGRWRRATTQSVKLELFNQGRRVFTMCVISHNIDKQRKDRVQKTNEWVRHVAALKKSDVAVSRNGRDRKSVV